MTHPPGLNATAGVLLYIVVGISLPQVRLPMPP